MRLRIESQDHWQRRRFDLLPASWVGRVREGFEERCVAREWGGNEYLRTVTEPFERLVVPLGASDADICDLAKTKARDLFGLACSVPVSSARSVREMLSAAVRRLGIDPPAGPMVTDAGAVKRMTDYQWWRRKLRRLHGHKMEGAAIGLGFVHRREQPYASDETVWRRGQQRRRNAAMLADAVAISEDGDAFTLAELAARSVANPEIRRGELMTRIRGFEEVAAGLGHAADFWTMTCPSRMHARLHGSGLKNPAYDETSPRDAQRYLGRVWGRVRAALARRGVALYGFRIAEPHHDGTPHWHLLVFCPLADRQAIRETMRRYALADSPNEAGANEYRCKFVAIDAGKGTAAGYVAKYVAKNIDGYRVERVEQDLFGNDAIEASQRVEAWARVWGIRQFQQVGGPPVGVWRELRRMAEVVPDEVGGGRTIEAARVAADAGDWRRYVEVMGGPICRRNRRPVLIDYGPAMASNPVTGARVPAVTRYGEPAPDRPVGVFEVWTGRAVQAVRKLWRILSRAGAAMFGFRLSRTRVNNCTGVEDGDKAGRDRSGGGGGPDRVGGGSALREGGCG